MKNSEHLTDKQERYAQYLAAGMESQAAARKAGYSDSFARVAAFRMKKKPAVAKALASIQAEGRKMAVYDLAKAMQEAAEVIEFAKQHKHPTAYFFAVRHRAHLSGLLVDKIQLEATVDLKGALIEARGRVFTIMTVASKPSEVLTDARGTGTDTASDGPDTAGNGPDEKGNPFGD
jgi:phage terminase small subunit